VESNRTRHFVFAFSAKFAGQGIVAVKDEGSQSHEMPIYRLEPGTTLAEAKQFLTSPPGAPPPIPAPGTFVGGITGVAPTPRATSTSS